MKILLGVHHYPPTHVGGTELDAERSSHALRRRGHDVRIVCVERIDAGPAGGVEWTDGLHDGVPVRRLRFDLAKAPDRFRWEYDNPWVHAHLGEMFARFRPDVFLFFGGYLLSGSALRAARESGIPAVVQLMDFWYLCPRITLLRSDGSLSGAPIDPVSCARCLGEESRRYRIPGRVAPGLMRAFWSLRRRKIARVKDRLDTLMPLLEGAEAVLSGSQFLRHIYVQAGLAPGKVHFVRQGVEPPTEAEVREPPKGTLRLAYVGTFAPLKGVEVLLHAMRAVRDPRIELALYGDIDERSEYVRRLRALAAGDSRIHWRGRYQHAGGLGRALGQTDALVVPSVWYENSPTVILEAYTYGVPVITSDLGGMAELVRHDESGLLFPAGNSAGLAGQIRRLMAEPSLLAVLRAGIPPVKSIDERVAELESWCRRASNPGGIG